MVDPNGFTILEASPFKQYGDYFIAAVSNDSGHFLKVLKFDPTKEADNCYDELSAVKVSDQITSLSWSQNCTDDQQEYLGLLMAGHANGLLSLWSSTQLLNYPAEKINHGLIKSFKGFHHSKVNCIKFNQKQPNLAATASNELILVQITHENNGGYGLVIAFNCANNEDKQEITSVQWNDKVPYILSAASNSAVVYVWDMKKKKIHLKIKDPSMTDDVKCIKTSSTWSSDGVQILIAYDENEYNFITQYHVSQLNAPYAEYHGGHKKSIIDIQKNPHDPNILLSLGRDNSITCWSIKTQKIFATFQKKEKIIQILWSPKFPDTFISVNESGLIEVTQINFSANPELYKDEEEEIPKWLAKKVSSAFGWGGRFVTYSEKFGPQITVHSLNKGNALTNVLSSFVSKLESKDKTIIIDEKIALLKIHEAQGGDKSITLMWAALKSVCTKNYDELFKHFGKDKEKLIEEANSNIGKFKAQKATRANPTKGVKPQIKDADSIFNSLGDSESPNTITTKPKEQEKEEPNTQKIELTRNLNWNLQNEKHIKGALLAGDLELAMENAFKADRDIEALLIASCDPDLFAKAKAKYFYKSNDLFIKNVFASIINKNFNHLFNSNLKDWKEYILYALTYLDRSEFYKFAATLADKLLQLGEFYSGIVCYLIANKAGLVIEKLYENYKTRSEAAPTSEEKESLLHQIFEEVMTINSIFNENTHHELTNSILVDYCGLLVNHKLYKEACTLLNKLKNPEVSTLILLDRIYGNNEDKFNSLFKKPQTPFTEVHIKPYIPPVQKKPVAQINTKIQAPTIAAEFFSGPPKQNIKSGVPAPIVQPQIDTTKKTEEPVVKPLNPRGPQIVKPPVINPTKIASQTATPFNPSSVSTLSQPSSSTTLQQPVNIPSKKIPSKEEPQQQSGELDEEESKIFVEFEKYQALFNSIYTDETKQKDMATKIAILFNKLKNHEIKPVLKKLLIQFIDGTTIFNIYFIISIQQWSCI